MTNTSPISKLGKELERYAIDYLVLISATVITISILSLYRGMPSAQFSMLVLYVTFYIFWGVMHHIRDKTFHMKIIMEYVLIGFSVLLFMYALV